MARIKAIMRRITRDESQAQKVILDNLTISLDDYSVTMDDNLIPLTKKEIEILWMLANTKNKVFSRDNLLNSLWGYDYIGDNRTVDSHIKRLRAKVDQIPHPSWDIKTVWGIGYKFEVNPDEV